MSHSFFLVFNCLFVSRSQKTRQSFLNRFSSFPSLNILVLVFLFGAKWPSRLTNESKKNSTGLLKYTFAMYVTQEMPSSNFFAQEIPDDFTCYKIKSFV